MEPAKAATTTLWAALAFTWLAAAVPASKDPEDPPRTAAAGRESATPGN